MKENIIYKIKSFLLENIDIIIDISFVILTILVLLIVTNKL